MRKIGIATITYTKEEAYNYGNVLQNYALSKFLSEFEYEVETIYYNASIPAFTKKMEQMNKKKRITLIQLVDDVLRVVRRKLFKRKLAEKKIERNKAFAKFIDRNIRYSTHDYDFQSDFSELNELYDKIIVGSDQVWNPYYEGSNVFFYLPFLEKNKRITYAPSLGVNHIPLEMKEKIGKWLRNFDAITIREKSGQEMLHTEYGILSTVVCDPVFLLKKEEWISLAGERLTSDKYICTYFLGKQMNRTKNYVKRLSKKYGFRIIDIYSWDNPDSYFAGPKEFLSLIKDAEFVVTDSFHGVAFSIIFDKIIALVDRNSSVTKKEYDMSNRIYDLIKIAGLGNRNLDSLMEFDDDVYHNTRTNNNMNDFIQNSRGILKKSLNED